MNKVIIEITAKGWTTKVILDDREFSETHKKTPYGCTSVGQVLTPDIIGDNLEHAISGIGYDIMKELVEIKEVVSE